MNILYILFRRGKKEYINDLYKNGYIYINTIDYIRECDNIKERSDLDDSIAERKYLGEVKIKMSDVDSDNLNQGVSFNGENCSMTFDSISKGNIYCLSGIFTKHLIDKSEIFEFNTQAFGESLIVIYNPRKFIDRIVSTLKFRGYNDFKFAPVSYYSNDYSGKVGFFRKHEEYSYQSEFRILVPNSNNIAISLNIGSLEDIAEIEKNYLSLELTDNRTKIIKLL
jgi:hypothetical protein